MIDSRKRRRVVITGLGVVAPNGIGKQAFWEATRRGASGITQLSEQQTTRESLVHVGGTIQNFLVQDYLDHKLANRTDRMTHFAIAAIQEALEDAQLVMEQEQPERVGLVIANTMGGVDYVLKQLQALYTRGPRFMSAFTAIAWLHVANVGHATIRYGIQGYCKTPVNDTVGGLDALGMAALAIQRGSADVIIAGGCEAFLHPFILLILSQQGQMVTGFDPDAYRPFDQRASGLILAEGAGICVLEEYEHARERGAPIYGELVGYGQTNDAHGLQPPSADGTRYAQALCMTMQAGNIQPAEISYLSLDGRAIPASDQGEVDALMQVFGPAWSHLPVSVPRTMLGHSYAAAGAIDAVIALLALKHGLIPPTINSEQPDPRYPLRLVRELETLSSKGVVLIGGRGVGGANVALGLRKLD